LKEDPLVIVVRMKKTTIMTAKKGKKCLSVLSSLLLRYAALKAALKLAVAPVVVPAVAVVIVVSPVVVTPVVVAHDVVAVADMICSGLYCKWVVDGIQTGLASSHTVGGCGAGDF
jgi:hypothetical protein